MILFIKNVIAGNSINEVRDIFEKFGLQPTFIELGEVEITEQLTTSRYAHLHRVLQNHGYELIMDKEVILFEKIKIVIIQMVHHSCELPATKYSDYISNKLKMNYTYLSKFFSRIKKMTLEKFIIIQKIELVKQLLLFNKLTLSEIAWRLNYSSTAHLSAQFKKFTGLTPSLFKKLKHPEITSPERL